MVCVIGDVHGCYQTLLRLIDKLPKDDKIVFVGDLIDRGPKSKEVVEFVIANNYPIVLGNHCEMMITLDYWLQNGGGATLKSYGLCSSPSSLRNLKRYMNENKVLLNTHREWMKNLPLYLLFDDIVDEKENKLVVSHSYVGSAWKLKDKKDCYFDFKEHLLWNRSFPFPVPGIFNVYGHTPVKEPYVTDFCADIDTGAVYKHKLTAFRFPEMEIYQQKFVD